MLQQFRRHLTYSNVVATCALVLACAGGPAMAARLITGTDIKDSTIRGRDVANASLSASDINAATNNLYSDVAPWKKIPSGKTVTGEYYFDTSASTGNAQDYSSTVTLPGIAPYALLGSTVNFAPDAYAQTSDDDATCTGTVSEPTAPPGKVCIYAASITSDSTNVVATPMFYLPKRGFEIAWAESASDADVFLRATWAYTAP